MIYPWNIVAYCCIINIAIAKNVSKESIGFPEPEEDINLANKAERQPVYIPAMCPINELFYPGDQKDDWICDCRPAFLYHPKTDMCWEAYRKGPCEVGNYLVLTENSAIPICERNPCSTDGYVMYNGRCELLGTILPCRQLWPMAAALVVNSTTISVSCERIKLETRFGNDAPAKLTKVECPPGCKRSITGKCISVTP